MLRDRYDPMNLLASIPTLSRQRDPVLTQRDTLLDDAVLLQAVKTALRTRSPPPARDGRPSPPVEGMLRMLTVQPFSGGRVPQTAHYVSDSLVLRQCCRISVAPRAGSPRPPGLSTPGDAGPQTAPRRDGGVHQYPSPDRQYAAARWRTGAQSGVGDGRIMAAGWGRRHPGDRDGLCPAGPGQEDAAYGGRAPAGRGGRGAAQKYLSCPARLDHHGCSLCQTCASGGECPDHGRAPAGRGTAGPRRVRAMVAGERAPMPLAALRPCRCQQEAAERALALTGPWRAAPLVVLPPALARCEGYTTPWSACAAHIARGCSGLTPRFAPAPQESRPSDAAPPPRRTPHAQSKQAPDGTTRAHRLRLTGGELVAVPGGSASLAQTMGSESGMDMSIGRKDTPFCSGLGRAPQHAISGGQGLTSRPRQPRHRAAPAFRMAAQAVRRAHCALGAVYCRVNGRLGPARALVATAHNLARTGSPLLTAQGPDQDSGAAEYNQRGRARVAACTKESGHARLPALPG
jgi:hypothetical protein